MTRLVTSALAALVLFELLAMATAAKAQDFYTRRGYEQPQGDRVYRDRDDAYFQQRMQYYRRDAVARREADRRRGDGDERPRQQGFSGFLQRLFGGAQGGDRDRADTGAVELRPSQRPPRRRPAVPPAPGATPPGGAPGDIAGAPLPPNVVALPKVDPTTIAAVFGDSVADGLAGGLEEAFLEQPDVAIRRHVKPNAGLVRADYFDLVAEAEKAVAAGPITYAIVDVGVNDRQGFLDMKGAPPLSDAWTERYASRVDALLAPFRERKIPVYWVGVAPSESARASADGSAINAIVKERVEAAGATYVDVWEGFVDEDGAYAGEGPQLDGQTGRLRLDDGVNFSREGARKLAHYVEREIRKVYAPPPATFVGAVSPTGDPTPQPFVEAQAARLRPIASPIVVLTAPRSATGGALAAAVAIPARDASPDAERVLVNGETLDAAPGRLDDDRWPGSDRPKPVSADAGSAAGAKPQPIPATPSPALIDPRPIAQQPPK